MNNTANRTIANRTVLSRRDWLAAAAGGAALWAAPRPASAVDLERHPWIDAHSHIWTRNTKKFPLADGVGLDALDPPSFTAEELLPIAHRHGVGRVVLIAHNPFYGWDNSYLIDAAGRRPETFRVVGAVDHFSAEPGRQMRELLAKRVTGFRITPTVYGEKWLGGGMDQMWETAAETGQSMCCLINPENIAEVDAMCGRHPATPVVIDHFARVGVDGRIRGEQVKALCRLARHRHTFVKLSAYYALGEKRPPYLDLAPMVRRVVDAFGVERLMWASDAPYQLQEENTYGASLALIRDRLDFLSDGDRQWLLRKTAENVFFGVG